MDYGLLKKYTRDFNVLFVEDDKEFRKEFTELLLDIFPNVTTAIDGLDGQNKYIDFYKNTNKYFDLVISDIKMPNMDGVELIDSIYKINVNQIVIILSARSEFNYLLPLVNLGIHQFFTKPINYKTFLDDIFKLCNQIYYNNSNDDNNCIIKINESLIWDKEKKELIQNNKTIKLTKNELRFVDTILNNNGKVCTVDNLINVVWYDEFDISIDITHLKSLIYRLRKKAPGLYIKNIYGMGYKTDSNF